MSARRIGGGPPSISYNVAMDRLGWYVVTELQYGADPTGAENSTAAIQAAIDAASAAGGGIVYFPPGTYLLDSDTVATNEGTAITIETGQDNVTLRGSGRGVTIIKPASNKIEMFLQIGGTDLAFEDITFRNPAGPLLNQVKPGSKTPGGGVAGLGNVACCAIRVALGGGLRLTRCEFEGFTCDVDYIGNWEDDSELVGLVTQDDVIHRGCCFGLLAAQPEYLINRNVQSFDVIASINADASKDPGHELYVTNRPGAHPKLIYCEGSYAENGHQSGIKIRKGELVVLNGITSYLCGRGPEIWGAKQIIAHGINSKLADVDAADSNASGLELTDCGPSEISGVYVDVNGSNAWGVRVRGPSGDGAVEAWHNDNIRLTDCTVTSDNSGASGKAAIIIDGQTDMLLDNFRFVHTGATASTKKPIDAYNCTRLIIRNPIHQALSAPSDAGKIASFDENCVDCRILFDDSGGTLVDGMIVSASPDALATIERSEPRYGILLPETRKLINVMASEPRRQRSFLIDDTIQGLIDAGIWDKLGALWVFTAHAEGPALVNWRYPTFMTAINRDAAAFAADQGFTGSTGNSDRIEVADLSTTPLFLQDDAHAAIWVEDGTSTTGALGQNSSATAATLLIIPYNGTNFTARLGAATTDTVGAVADRNGMYVVSRSVSTDYDGYKDGALVGNVVRTSTGISGAAICALRVGTTETDDRVLMVSLGGALTAGEVGDFHTIMSAYFTDLGAI